MSEQHQDSIDNESEKELGQIEVFLSEEINADLLVQVYRTYLDDTHQLRSERQAVDNTRVTIVTLFLGAEAYVASLVFTGPQTNGLLSLSASSWIPVVVSMLIGVVGYMFCNNWKGLSQDFKKNLRVKYEGLKKMETKWKEQLEPLGVTLFTDEDRERKKAREQHPNGRGVGKRNQDLQEFFQWVFVALIFGALIPKVSVVGFTIAQAHWNLLHLF